jgi:hemoglobin
VTPDDIRTLERRRLRSLVDADLEIARALHAPDYQLITPGGRTYSRDEYLSAIESGEVDYARFEPEDESAVAVRLWTDSAAVRYVARIDITYPGGEDHVRVWHTDLWERGDEGWRATWSHATQIGAVTLYHAAGGADGLRRLAAAWHARVLADEVVSHAFSHGFRADHSERLAAYWSEALGGPPSYSERYGDESLVVRLHSGNGEHLEMDRRAIEAFDAALVDAGLGADDRLRDALHAYFAWVTTTTMSAYHESADAVPAGLTIPRWSWEGLVEEPVGEGAGA